MKGYNQEDEEPRGELQGMPRTTKSVSSYVTHVEIFGRFLVIRHDRVAYSKDRAVDVKTTGSRVSKYKQRQLQPTKAIIVNVALVTQ